LTRGQGEREIKKEFGKKSKVIFYRLMILNSRIIYHGIVILFKVIVLASMAVIKATVSKTWLWIGRLMIIIIK
jgi:hypothetical protein